MPLQSPITNAILREEISRSVCPLPAEPDDWKAYIAIHIRSLLDRDFHQLVQLLYRIDVPETQVRKILEDYPERDAGELIAELMINRVIEKLRLRGQFTRRPPEEDSPERW